jgi:DNA-binding NarL/FixJ family response regulator
MKLTQREMQIVEMITKGHKNKEIADTLGIKLNSIKNSIKQIYKKFGITNVKYPRVLLAARFAPWV